MSDDQPNDDIFDDAFETVETEEEETVTEDSSTEEEFEQPTEEENEEIFDLKDEPMKDSNLTPESNEEIRLEKEELEKQYDADEISEEEYEEELEKLNSNIDEEEKEGEEGEDEEPDYEMSFIERVKAALGLTEDNFEAEYLLDENIIGDFTPVTSPAIADEAFNRLRSEGAYRPWRESHEKKFDDEEIEAVLGPKNERLALLTDFDELIHQLGDDIIEITSYNEFGEGRKDVNKIEEYGLTTEMIPHQNEFGFLMGGAGTMFYNLGDELNLHEIEVEYLKHAYKVVAEELNYDELTTPELPLFIRTTPEYSNEVIKESFDAPEEAEETEGEEEEENEENSTTEENIDSSNAEDDVERKEEES